MSNIEDKLIQDIKKDLLKDKIILFLLKYKKIIVAVIVLIIVFLIGMQVYFYNQAQKAKKYSLEFDSAKEAIMSKNNEEALNILNNIIKDGNQGYKFISYMQKASVYINDKKFKEAIETLQEAQKEVSLPKYYGEMIQSIEYSLRMDYDDNKELLLSDIETNLNKKSSYYLLNLDIYAALLVDVKQYQKASDIYQEIISSENAPQNIKDRAKRIRGMLFAYMD